MSAYRQCVPVPSHSRGMPGAGHPQIVGAWYTADART
jgi:hypothetical protein